MDLFPEHDDQDVVDWVSTKIDLPWTWESNQDVELNDRIELVGPNVLHRL